CTFTKQNVPRMKIAMNLPQAISSVLQTPPPFDASTFDLLKQLAVDYIGVARITIDEAHDAFRVANQFTNSANIESGLIPFHAVNLDQVIAEGVRTRDIGVGEHRGLILHS